MKIKLSELRNYIRNAMAPSEADREQLSSMGKRGWDMGVLHQEGEDAIDDDDLTIDRGPRDIGLGISDPYVNQDRPAPTTSIKRGRTGP